MDVNVHVLVMFVCCLSLGSSAVEISNMHTSNAERQIMEHLFQNYSIKERPVLNASESLGVVTSMFLNAILDLNEKEQILRTSAWITFNWHDPRLTWKPEDFEGVDLINVALEDVWLPKVYLNNGVEMEPVIDLSRGNILLTSEGELNLGTPLLQLTHCPVRIKYFPFDTQVCVVNFNTLNVPAEKMTLIAGASVMGVDTSSMEWEALELNNTDTIFQVSGIVDNRKSIGFSQVKFCLYLRRFPNYYVTLLIVPSIVLNVMATLTFLSPPEGGERISLTVSMILGLSVFQLLIADILPNTKEDAPILGTYLTANFILAVCSIPFSLLTVNLIYNSDKSTICQRVLLRVTRCVSRGFATSRTKQNPRRRGPIDKSAIKVVFSNDIGKDMATTDVQQVHQHQQDDTSLKQELELTKTIPPERESNAKSVAADARRIATILDRLFLVMFLTFMLFKFVLMIVYLRNGDDYVRRGDCEGFQETRRVDFT